MNLRLINIFFLLFALSGFAGLIYESIWSHYMKLFLGHAAYAQTLVLSIFMGGMAIGSWFCSKYSIRWKNLLIGYAIVEGMIGLFALIFHTGFDNIVQLSYTTIIPRLGTPLTASIFKWTLSALIILPQSILIGMPFPLMTAGILRIFPQNPGRSVSMLYFTNSIGAAIGVLASGFMLIKLVGLPGTIKTAGIINIAVAVIVLLLAKKYKIEPSPEMLTKRSDKKADKNAWYRLLLLASLITGTASFIYEIGWIRMLSLVLGSSNHAFELMLSAFIIGLSLGGLWIKRRIDYIANPVRFLVFVQVIMGILALSTLPLYGNTFKVMQWVMKTVSKTDTGYLIFNLSSYSIALAIMLPTTFCAGMTLPLITYILIKQGNGERSIGAVYAANTVGAIIGILFAIHIGMPLLNLRGLLIFGGGLDIALGIGLLWGVSEKYKNNRIPSAITALGLCAVILTPFLVKLDPYRMSSGVYRYGGLLSPTNTQLVYYKDGKTSTVSISVQQDGILNIRTNGKVEAGINVDPNAEGCSDEATMILAAALPMAFHTDAKTVANIGLGSGLTTHTLLSNPYLEEVDTVEIEKYVVEAAKFFGPRVELAFTDPRSKLYIDDAKTFFTSNNQKYDIIVSEPSNPWVSGVACLFTEEFYRIIDRHLNENGLFVQWFQLYEIDLNLVASVFKALSSNFSDYVVYAPYSGDILIIAKKGGTIDNYNLDIFKIPRIAHALKRVFIENIQDIEVRKIGNKRILEKLFETFPVNANSDYYPILDQDAARTRFLSTHAGEIISLCHDPSNSLEMLMGLSRPWEKTDITPTPLFPKTQAVYKAMVFRDYLLHGSFSARYGDIPEDIKYQAVQLRRFLYETQSVNDPYVRMDCLFNMAIQLVPYLSTGELETIWGPLESSRNINLFSSTEKKWITLLKAVGRNDGKTMVCASKTLLESGQDMPPVAIKYLIASGMLGYLTQGDKEGSFQFWSKYQSTIFKIGQTGLLFRLLVANSEIH